MIRALGILASLFTTNFAHATVLLVDVGEYRRVCHTAWLMPAAKPGGPRLPATSTTITKIVVTKEDGALRSVWTQIAGESSIDGKRQPARPHDPSTPPLPDVVIHQTIAAVGRDLFRATEVISIDGHENTLVTLFRRDETGVSRILSTTLAGQKAADEGPNFFFRTSEGGQIGSEENTPSQTIDLNGRARTAPRKWSDRSICETSPVGEKE